MRRIHYTERAVIDLSRVPEKLGAAEFTLVQYIRKFSVQPNSGSARSDVFSRISEQR